MLRALMALAALSLAACAAPEAPPDDPEFELQLAQQIALDVPSLKLGDWAIYAFQRQGGPRQFIRYAAVEQEGTEIWVENKIPTEGGATIQKYKLDYSGLVLERWVGQSGFTPTRTYPRQGRPPEPPPRRESNEARAETRQEADTLKIGARTYVCTKITTTLAYAGGRRRTMVNWLSKNAPGWLGASTGDHGGLVRRQVGIFTMELFDHGNSPRPIPELLIPK